MSKALLFIALILASLSTSLVLDATEQTVESLSGSAEDTYADNEDREDLESSEDADSTHRKPLWKKLIGLGVIVLSVTGAASDALNVGGAIDTRHVNIALAYNETLPASTDRCAYAYSLDCGEILNEELCQEYREQAEALERDGFIRGECTLNEIDGYRLAFGITSFVTRALTKPFTYAGLSRFLRS